MLQRLGVRLSICLNTHLVGLYRSIRQAEEACRRVSLEYLSGNSQGLEKSMHWVETRHSGGASRLPVLLRTIIFLPEVNLSLTAKSYNPRHRETNLKAENKESRKLST